MKASAPDVRKDSEIIQRIAHRAFVFATKMIYEANHRPDQQEGDPKVGGHPAACSSCVHIMSALHLGMRRPQDFFAVKPHASPVDHSLNHLMGLHHAPSGREWLSEEESKAAMFRLRKFSEHGEPVFQSYHAENDPDGNAFFPSGSVGIPPVVSIYTSLAYRYAEDHGLTVPKDAYFWSLMGDSEFREGSLMEAMPDASERELGNVIWIVDYNRQNLDGTRIPNNRGLRGTDAHRMERVAEANGWEVIQVRHGRKRQALFAKAGGAELKQLLEDGFSDFEFQMMLLKRDGKVVRERLLDMKPGLKKLLSPISDADLYAAFADLGGHDVEALLDAFVRAKKDRLRPTLIIAHTIKGWGLSSYAAPGNHSAVPDAEEVDALLDTEGLRKDDPFGLFGADTEEGKFLARRRKEMREGIEEIWALKDKNAATFASHMEAAGGFPEVMGVDLKMTPLVHTQYVWGQLAGKLIRIGNRHEDHRKGDLPAGKELTDEERRWGPGADMVLTMAPDVGTSTNINPAMDDKIYGPDQPDFENKLGLRDRRRPALVPTEEAWTRHIRFEIAEANCMSAVGAFGKMRDHVGLPFLPVMTIYDFFIKRAYDQLYYNLYWKSGFICVGTPSGVTLSPEGAQHSWKSDIQMPNLITWEPFFALEVDWILSESVRRHFTGNDAGRSGVLIRCVTKAVRQAEMIKRLKVAKRHEGRSDEEILEAARKDALEGAYYLVDWRGYPDYQPGDNVVNVFAMGAVTAEALHACDRLRAEGIFANVIVVTSGDLLAGNLAHENDYRHLREGLGVSGDLFLVKPAGTNGHGPEIADRADLVMAAGRRVPLVTVVDGEPGLIDNLGSIVGVKSVDLAVRKPSKCGRPVDVYGYLHIDGEAVYQAVGEVLTSTALENVRVSPRLLTEEPVTVGNAERRGELWPPRQ